MTRGVLITCVPPAPLESSSSSGLLFSDNLVLTIGAILEPFLSDTSTTSLTDRASAAHYTVLVEERHYHARPAFAWRCPLVADTIKNVLTSWHMAPDKQDNQDYKELLSMFIVLQLDPPGDCDRLPPTVTLRRVMSALSRLLEETTKVRRSQEVVVEATPFGRKFFLNSLSEGVVSNRLGVKGCLVMTDARSTLGCEGGPVFTADRTGGKRRLVGLVMASVSWWKGEWVGFTFVVDLRPVLRRIVMNQRDVTPSPMTDAGLGDTVTGDQSVVLVRCGKSWGSGVVVDASRGLVITCSHVINTDQPGGVGVVWRGVAHEATLLYRTRDGVAYDLALLRVASPASQWRSVVVNPVTPIRGTRVVVVGYPLFDEHTSSSPSITRGVVSHVCDDVMLQTTCCVQSGASGGAVLDESGALVGVVSCNARDTDTGALYPHVNMVVPAAAFNKILQHFIATGDAGVLRKFEAADEHTQKLWQMKFPTSKL